HDVLRSDRVICSTITLRHLPLAEALAEISRLGFTEIDLGALPGVCDHVPYVLDDTAVAEVARTVGASGLMVRSVNADIGDLNRPLTAAEQRARLAHADKLIALSLAIGATGLVLPNGAQQHDPIVDLPADLDLVAAQLIMVEERCAAAGLQLWVEAPHFFRLCYNLDRTAQLLRRLPQNIGIICDVSHIVASGSTPPEFVELVGDRITHVHIRDAEPGYIHHSVGRGHVDFAATVQALTAADYEGRFALELETRDITNDERPQAALAAGIYLSSLL
ncbi:MAG TPA: sugar phosphate isomerase/epimerase, partial [Microlunatus sp.]|nr:sugar phosphate isomerase/epimerase [Microlunatus sp.]